MADDFLFARFGDVQFPVPGTDVADDQLFSAFDPVRDTLIALFQTALVAELAKAWNVARVGTRLSDREPVADVLHEMPRRGLLQQQLFKYPLLCVYRTSSTSDELTLWRERITQLWGVDYIIGPLDPAEYRRLGGALQAAQKLLQLTLRQSGHPAYLGGRVVLTPDNGGLDTARVVSTQIGPAQYGETDEGQEFHAMSMVLETTELDALDLDAIPVFEGVTATLGVGDAFQVFPDLVVGDTSVPLQPPPPP